jgi:glycolate oxidase FAD binding subunit
MVVVRGAGTKLTWGRRPGPVDLVLSLRRLNRVLSHEHADLIASVEAGTTLAAVNGALARHGQWLPLDAADGATIGGTIATNDSGPLRHRYGTPRDLLIGVRLATADGRLVKAGGNVVKNVAGYDLGKLVSGSYGTLAVIVSATFKLSPVPASSKTLVATFQNGDAAARAVAAVSASQLEPAAQEIQAAASAGPQHPAAHRLLIRFATASGATDAQIECARALVAGGDAGVVSGEEETTLWRDHTNQIWAMPGSVLKAGWLPATLPAVLALVDELGREGRAVALIGRAGVGSGLIRLDGDPAWQASTIERLRALPDLVRHVTVLRAPASVRNTVDTWGPLGAAGTLAAAVKRALDPGGILNAGRGPV